MHIPFRRSRRATVVAMLLFGATVSHGKTATEVYEQASASTVIVRNVNLLAKTQSTGSGVVLGDGQVVTNCHVINNPHLLTVRSEGKEYPASLHYADWARDLCSLTVAGLNVAAASIGNSSTLKIGAKVYALGTPKGLALTLSDGIISGFRERKGGRYIQTTAAISRGSSGGGLFDDNGALIGLTTFYMADGQNLNFAIPIEWVSELAQRSTLDPPLETLALISPTSQIARPASKWQSQSKQLETSSDWVALLQHSEQWTRAEANNDEAWRSRGIALYQTGQTKQSIEAWGKAVRVNPDDADIWLLLGAAQTRAGHRAQAIEAYQHGLSLDPKDAVSWYSLGEHYEQSGQWRNVRDVYKKLKQLDPLLAEKFFSMVVMH